MASSDVPPNSVGWHILEGYPWWPVYICDATKLRPNLHILGSGHKGILRKARDFPKDYAIVYFFGSHDFGQVRLNKGVVLKPWECADKENFLKGHPKHLIKKKAALDDLLFAIQEAEDYLSTSEDIRLPPHMVPSDLDPSIDPPPPIEPEELMEEEDEDAGDEDAAASDHGDDQEQEDEDMSGGSDNETNSKSKSKKKLAKEKKSKEKKVTKEKKPAKEKKTSKPKKEKASSSKEPKEKKKSVKKDNEPSASNASQEDKKRKKPVAVDEASSSSAAAGASPDAASEAPASGKASPGRASPSKVARKEKVADVKSGDAKPSSSKKSKGSGSELTGEALSAVLEKEIKWILANCQFDEMTTKTVRKLLEKRLNMDLRHHKASIKEGVARVIASMEDGTDAPADDVVVPVKTEPALPSDPAPADDAEGVAAPPPASSPVAEAEDAEMVKQEEPEAMAESEEPEAIKDNDATRVMQRLADAERELGLAMSEEPKLVKALTALQQQQPTVDKELFAKSPLVFKLVELRAHEEDSVANLVAVIATQWDVEELVPAPKPIREEDILEMKEKLESPETSHDDMLACLGQLAKMRLQMSHLKNTGIARAVANLRQHANDKVSIAAINLRKSWIQLTKSKTDSGSDVDRVKSLESMNRILEEKDAQEGESSHLAVLEKLQSMTLSTQDIIKSKIGVVVSKLRKSSNEKVAKAATMLRKKWKAEAAA